MSAFKAIFISGMQSWWSDKTSIRQRFIYWPIAIPIIMIGFMALAIFALQSRSGEGGELSIMSSLFLPYECHLQQAA